MEAEREKHRTRRVGGPLANFDPDTQHRYPSSYYGVPGWQVIPSAGVSPEFDGIEYEDETVPPELH
jgi:hypothetical protein